jgi:hypothetical protein
VDLLPKPSAAGKLRKHADEQGLTAAIWLEPNGSDRASVWTKHDGLTRAAQSASEIAGLLHEMRGYAQQAS